MGIESVQAVQGRIAEIQQSLGALGGTAPVSGQWRGSFAGALRQAMEITGAFPASAATGSGAPPGLEAFANGRIPDAALTAVAPGQRLWGPAAEAFMRLASDAEAAGVNLRVVDSYGSFDEQVDIARRKGLYSQGGLAAAPGTSTHGWGLSVDVDTAPQTLAWMRANAGQYGFVEDVPREPWHWTYRPAPTGPPGAVFDPAARQLPR